MDAPTSSVLMAAAIDLSRFVGIKYVPYGRSFDGCDCYGLIYLFYREAYSIELPTYDGCYDLGDADKIRELVNREKQQQTSSTSQTGIIWQRINVLQASFGDVLLFHSVNVGYHVGIALNDRRMLHTTQRLGWSVIETFQSPKWIPKLEGTYRVAGCL